MSLFSKVLSRAAVPGVVIGISAVPKGHVPPLRRAESPNEGPEALTLRRMEEEEEMAQTLHRVEGEEEVAQSLRRAEEDAQPLHRVEEEEAQPLRRVEEEDAQSLQRAEEEEEAAQPLRRAEEEEEAAQPLHRAEEEEELQTLRRAEEEEEAQALHRAEVESGEEEAQALHRVEAESEEEEEMVQPLRRLDMQDEEMPKEPSPLQTLRRSTEGQAVAPVTDAGMGGQDGAAPVPGFVADLADQGWMPDAPVASLPERPKVQIDQIDVVIHEDTPSTTGGGSGDGLSRDLARRLRSTYLRGL